MNNILNENYRNANIFFDRATKDLMYSKGKKYIDLSYASGTSILGHGSNIQRKIFKDFIKKNLSLFSGPNKYAIELTVTLKKFIPDYYNKFIFCNSGTEAINKTLRIARAISKKKLIVNVAGSWHGSVDQLLYKADKKLRVKKISDGLNKEDEKNIVFIPYNNIKKTNQILNKIKKKISCILVEPIQGSLPNEYSYKYLKFLSDFAKKNKILLIFDEMITGIRANCKTIQDIYNLKPDISTFGKIFGGGMPIGFITISNNIYSKLIKKKIKIHFGGTFSANPFSMYAANQTLIFIYKNKKKIFTKIENFSERFQKEINSFCLKNNIDIKVSRFQSMMRIIFSDKHIQNRTQRDQLEKSKNKKITLFKKYLEKNNIFYPNNGIIFFSYQSSKKNFDYVLKIVKNGIKKYF